MKNIHLFTFATSILTASLTPFASAEESYTITASEPGDHWIDGSPLGNGSMGAMLLGGVAIEDIYLNEDTLWSGEPAGKRNGEKHLAGIKEVRKLLAESKFNQANQLGNQTMLGVYRGVALPLGKLQLEMPHLKGKKVTQYERSLSLNDGVSTTKFTVAGVEYTRTVFVSKPDQVMVVKLTASRPKAINLRVTLGSKLRHQVSDKSGILTLLGKAPIYVFPYNHTPVVKYDNSEKNLGMRFSALLDIQHKGGHKWALGSGYSLQNADEVIIKISTATSYNGYGNSPSANGSDEVAKATKVLESANKLSYAKLLERHIADFSALFNRVEIELGDGEQKGKPVAQRLGAAVRKNNDPDLDELFYQFGRYLLISSSREGSQAAHLQGLWVRKVVASWGSNYTVNCNLQFNYIGAGAANLGDVSQPLHNLIAEASVDGAYVAKHWYGSGGWVFHHNLDVWRNAEPTAGSVLWATFPSAGAWSMVELYDNWKFTNDEATLKGLWPLMTGNVQFWIDTLQPDSKTGELISTPDVYFENSGKAPGKERAVLCEGPVSTTIVVRQSMLDLIEAAEKLGKQNDPIVKKAQETLKKMVDIEINPNGEIRQWHADKKGDWVEGDRTQTLVFQGAIYSNMIHPRLHPERAKALSLMMKNRKSGHGNVSSWRAAFPANAYARIGEGNNMHMVLQNMLAGSANPNLTIRFAHADWEIDSNLGVMGAMQECIVQSHAGEVELLPALPDAWKAKGHVKGLKLRGGRTIDIKWVNGKVTDWKIHGKGAKQKIRVNGKVIEA